MKAIELDNLKIEGIIEPAILNYFESFNAGKFTSTANLFARSGAIHPPFESSVVGKEAIALYLKKEADGMILYPQQGTREKLLDRNIRFEVVGKVKTATFSVNVAWQFILNPEREILHVQIKLLASLQELLKLRPEGKQLSL
ncbi:MAG: ketosteroid isomerase family protein [Prochloraceae cyanobacterium]